MGWEGSKHDLENVPCAACHSVHVREDRVLAKNIDPMRFTREGQASVCFQCHMEKRAQIQHRVSSHPLREGKINCSDCHNPHGSMGPTNLARPTLNETCYQCHAEKRGPFLWEHPPVREDCSICHEPHGSEQPDAAQAANAAAVRGMSPGELPSQHRLWRTRLRESPPAILRRRPNGRAIAAWWGAAA